ncbi:MAG: UDP-N-acetylglucosamine 2-epimerase (non-hydrolyzing) [Bacteroidales bacterium]|jgi:UDP-GlcNAc3NAcA epimerase|nr:UDP-N-acetylglucosamine 2-epimerase (non-hydrolyzing) [Bacteroidales bacterium]
MINIVTIVGARPQIIKAAALSRAVNGPFRDRLREVIVHTGQHYDHNLSQVFFDELQIPQPDINLDTGSASHGRQTARMIEGIEEILLDQRPRAVVLYGDTNSTLAGAVAASKLQVPVVHIEAGLRSFNKAMPEEVNRILCDHVSTLLFTPTLAGLRNLQHEGFVTGIEGPWSADHPGVFHCGDVMYDNSLYFAGMATQQSKILDRFGLTPGGYLLATIHRDHNTDQPERLEAIFGAIQQLAAEQEVTVVLPLHPRTRKIMAGNLSKALFAAVTNNPRIIFSEPVSFLDMINLEKHAAMILTDSGGVQKEAYFFRKPVMVLRPQTEWVEIVEQGAGRICDADPQKILEAYHYFRGQHGMDYPPVFGDGRAAEFIARKMVEAF